jgi:hypothetical protein
LTMSIKNEIIVGEYAKGHFIKPFKKKYKWVWSETFEYIIFMCWRVELFLKSKKINKIHICDNWYIAKWEFSVAWSRISTKTSWNRYIIFVDEINNVISILLVYSKNNISWNNETTWWENEIKKNYKEIYKLFNY